MSRFDPSALDRRSFLKGAAAGLVFLPHADLSKLDFRAARRVTQVAVIRTSSRQEGVRRAMALLAPTGMAGKRVVLKPNFNSADAAPASTHDDTVKQLVRELQERDARSITLGESSGPRGTVSVLDAKGTRDLGRDLGFDVVNFDEIADSDWVPFSPPGTHWPEGYHLPRLVTDAEYLVSTCCLKTHGSGGVFTMSMKLAVGLTPRPIRRPMHQSPDMRRMIAELNQGYRPDLVVMDGVEVFTDGGPSRGTLKQANVTIAGTDRVAVDAVGVAILKELGSNDAIMGKPIFEQEQIARAVEVKLGVQSPSEIALVSDDVDGRAYADKVGAILAQG
ncbi:MAG TPA: DUF362 domain-containing protein [Longimicrobiales bacterium]|nr:DUF362 domain-containing protein [Longimicrobiales bacterium]